MDKKQLIDGLNSDLAGEFGAIIQYLTYAAKATGPYRPQLSEFFLAEVPDEQGRVSPRQVPQAKSNREMVEAVLKAERQAIRDYSERAVQAEEFGDKGLVVQLEDIVRDETSHAEETERILRDWPL